MGKDPEEDAHRTENVECANTARALTDKRASPPQILLLQRRNIHLAQSWSKSSGLQGAALSAAARDDNIRRHLQGTGNDVSDQSLKSCVLYVQPAA